MFPRIPRSFPTYVVGLFGNVGNLIYYLYFNTPFPVDELLQKLTDLQSAVNTGKDSL